MENLKSFRKFLNEAKVQEKEGISPAIYKDLEQYFSGEKKPTLVGAQAFIQKKKKGWKLSQEDFKEAFKKFKG